MTTQEDLAARCPIKSFRTAMIRNCPSRCNTTGFRISLCALVILLITPLSSHGRDLVEGGCSLVPNEWRPSLEQAQVYIEKEFEAKTRKNQLYLNRTSQSMADLLDAQLFISYVLLMQTLDAKERSNLFDEQRHWLIKRERFARRAVVSKGGSLEPLEYSGAFRKITEERLAEIKKRLAQEQQTTGNNRAGEEKQP